jgi:hypothetical protein
MRGMEFYKAGSSLQPGQLLRLPGARHGWFLGVGGVLKVTLHKDGTWAGGKLVPTR